MGHSLSGRGSKESKSKSSCPLLLFGTMKVPASSRLGFNLEVVLHDLRIVFKVRHVSQLCVRVQ